MTTLVRCLVLCSSLSGLGLPAGAQTVVPAVPLLGSCTECHANDGVSKAPEVPHLDRQTYVYLQESIELLQSGVRPTSVAEHIPQQWSLTDIQTVARYYSRLQGVRPPEPVDPVKAAQGKEVFLEKCETCHEDGGRRTDYRGTGSPILAGQRIPYLTAQIRAYTTGRRQFLVDMHRRQFTGAPLVVNGYVIRERLDPVSDADAEALAHYLAARQPYDGTQRLRRSER